MKKLGVWVALIAALTSVILTGVFGAQAEPYAPFSRGLRQYVNFGEGDVAHILFVPDMSSAYDIYAFCENGSLRRVVLRTGKRTVARGAGAQHLFTTGLIAGQEYELEMEGTGSIEIAVMRHAPGRSIMWPEPVFEGAGEGRILLPGSSMWHSLEEISGRVSVYITPDAPGSARMDAEIYTSEGAAAGVSEEMAGGGCRLYFDADENTEYRLRVGCMNDGTGIYRVRVAEAADEAPDSLEIITDDLTMREGEMRSIRARTWPLDADEDMEWASSDPEVALVNENGVVTAVNPGAAEISVYAYGGLCATINVTVVEVEPEYIAYRGDFITVRAGDVLTPTMQVYPAAAADDERIVYESSAPEIVSVSDKGEITAHAIGVAVITVSYGDLMDALSVKVEEAPPRYRALMISEQSYLADVNTVRVGAVNTAYNLESLFSMASYEGEKCAVTVEVDLTAQEALDAIANTFAGAVEKDISILYISCHGYYVNGMTMLQFVDGSEIAACDLEAALRKIPGTVVIIADCCDSGGLIGTYADMADISGGIITAFAGEGAAFSSSKYKVLASAAVGQDSYRLGYSLDSSEAITVFAWALCDALGWDVDDQYRGPLSADADYDGKITLWEAYLYTDRRVMWYLSRAGSQYVQDVQVYPAGDMFTLFERE